MEVALIVRRQRLELRSRVCYQSPPECIKPVPAARVAERSIFYRLPLGADGVLQF